MGVIFLAFGLVLIVEGLAWLLAPSLVEQLLEMLRMLPEAARRQIGGLAVVSGLILLWIADWLGAL
ncbi:DUF2065 domain-containing protein [Sedimentitalea nanhaiensis]|uniref:DUF2065 domain-containing protein n=1 Tax=Sedimentitalea nanhaiensis TaxID=999627 RepID=A0A1I7E109_9RHOB|nr:DUF2065 domain-containing protein [Sedimentitalea nanhaiensis]SFU17618.1 hypothetical protein SAMN05216236_14030 [Sedimentitalea nanhaiensis]